jgi:hypothetical protein
MASTAPDSDQSEFCHPAPQGVCLIKENGNENNITVEVEAQYIEGQSEPDNSSACGGKT